MLGFLLKNTSNQSFGESSETGRALFVQLYYGNDTAYEFPLADVVVRGPGGEKLDIDPVGRAPGKEGYRRVVTFLPHGGKTTIQLSFKFNAKDARPASRAALQADIYLQKIPTLVPNGTPLPDKRKRLIQRRIFVASYQPKFDEQVEADVVLVTTVASSADQVGAWQALVADRLGLTTQIFSMSRYGHIDADDVAEQKKLQELFHGKQVVILNDEYCPLPNDEIQRKLLHRPSEFMRSAFDYDLSTRFLVVGGRSDSVGHMSPRATGVHTIAGDRSNDRFEVSDKENRKTFLSELKTSLDEERSSGFSTDRAMPSCQVVRIKTTSRRQPKPEKIDRLLEKRCKKLGRRLERHDKVRHYRVEWSTHVPRAVEKEKRSMFSCWDVGELRVYAGPARYQNSMVLVGEESDRSNLTSEQSISSLSMLYSFLLSSSLDTKLDCYSRSLRLLADGSYEHDEVCEVARDCIVGDYVWDVANYYDARLKIEDPRLRSDTITGLLANGSLGDVVEDARENEQLREVVTRHFSALLAGLKSAAKSKDLRPWWSPFSRKHGTRKAMRETIALLEEAWTHVLDVEQIASHRKTIDEDVKAHIKKERKKFWLRRKGRWRAALGVVFSPQNEKRYPRSPGFSCSSVRVRRLGELDNGASTKIKGFDAETAGPNESARLRASLSERSSRSLNLRKTVQEERGEMIQVEYDE